MKNCTKFILPKTITFFIIGYCSICCAPNIETGDSSEYPKFQQNQLEEASLMPNAYVINEQEPTTPISRLPPPVLAEKKISEEMLSEYFNATKYGIWVDDKRIDNADLINYDVNDFEYYMVSSLEKNARHYGLYDYHVSLLTAKGFRDLKSRLRLQETQAQSF